MRKRYRIEISQNRQDQHVYLPAELMHTMPLSRLSFGSRVIEADCIPHDKEKIIVGESVYNSLAIPGNEAILHAFSEQDTLFIGPLIGVLTSGFTSFPLRPLGDRTNIFAKLLSVNKSVGVMTFLFGEEHIDWEKGLIKGLFFEGQQWKTYEVPFPNVIYDRLPNRRSEKKANIKKVKERMQTDYLIPSYNPGFFSKLDIFERLYQDELACTFLPETHPFTSFTVIERMLADYGHVYVKPANGSLGLGIHQILFDRRNSTYYCRYQDNDGQKKLTKFNSLETLFKKVFHKRKLSNMIVQQGIHLIREEGRLIDFRIHTNKDEDGLWQITAMAAKVGGQGSPTTHIRTGGKVMTIEEVFRNRDDQEKFALALSSAALYLSKALESQVEGIIGEIGFDLGIDKEGRVWLFEANSKPGRSIFSHPNLKESDLLTRKLTLGFGIFLAEKAIKSPEALFT
ncbi:YheC/YheD family protein [Bacillus sp. FJAT-27251]|uniref:YheC/YheD family endospore coat-associated protein n=1 Tax=Bacillus sp. FJAT-27251 TaxID=1684142 RepID=UPI0006A7A1C6|nr:YheC/YheD family protein [Bacillus sp. FJAT-27251]